MGIVHVTRNFQPRLNLIVSLHTTCETSIIRSHSDTFILQIVSRTIERTLCTVSCSCKGIFLAQTILIGSISPIIRHQHILLTLVIDNITQCSIRVKLTIYTNKILTCRYRINVIVQAIISRVDHILVCPTISLASTVTQLVLSIIVQSCVPSLIVLSRTLNYIIIRKSLRVRTPLSIECK